MTIGHTKKRKYFKRESRKEFNKIFIINHFKRKYKGKARTLYCESTGLTEDFIKNASIVSLRLAAQNIGIGSSDVYENTQELRRKLSQFILPQN